MARYQTENRIQNTGKMSTGLALDSKGKTSLHH